MDGVLNINKPKSMTSFDVVAKVRKALNIRKVGHTGTLDPMATGVLVVCVGRATKIIDYIQSDKKTYLTEITLGLKTDTEDIWGEVLDTSNKKITEEEFENAILSFIGDIYQVPPMYSALKVNGKKLYELAREGKTVDRKQRLITIHNIDIVDINNSKAVFYVTCSKGTYIRTLCSDIGEKLGTYAVMSALERTENGKFHISNSIDISDLNELNYDSYRTTIDDALGFKKKIYVSNKAKELIQNGVKIDLMRYVDFDISDGDYVLVYNKNKFLALAKYNTKLQVVQLFDIKR